MPRTGPRSPLAAGSLLALLVVLAITACGAAAPAPAPMVAQESAAKQNANAPSAPPPAMPASAPRAAATAAPGGAGSSTGSAATGGTTASTTGIRNAAREIDRRIIRAATLTVTVKDVAPMVDRASALAEQYGGWVATSNVAQAGEGKLTAALTLKVPVDRYDALLRELRGLGTVNAESSTSQDVTDEFEDVQAQVKNLELLEARYQELLGKATTLTDTLTITQRINETRGQIDRLKGRLNVLTRRTDYSDITLNLRPEGLAVTRPGWQPTAEMAAAFAALLAVLQGLATVAIWLLIAGSPFLVLLGLIIWFFRRRRVARRPTTLPPAVPPAAPPPAPTAGATGTAG